MMNRAGRESALSFVFLLIAIVMSLIYVSANAQAGCPGKAVYQSGNTCEVHGTIDVRDCSDTKICPENNFYEFWDMKGAIKKCTACSSVDCGWQEVTVNDITFETKECADPPTCAPGAWETVVDAAEEVMKGRICTALSNPSCSNNESWKFEDKDYTSTFNYCKGCATFGYWLLMQDKTSHPELKFEFNPGELESLVSGHPLTGETVNVSFNAHIEACQNRIPMMRVKVNVVNESGGVESKLTGIYVQHRALDITSSTPMRGLEMPDTQKVFKKSYNLSWEVDAYRAWAFRKRLRQAIENVVASKGLTAPEPEGGWSGLSSGVPPEGIVVGDGNDKTFYSYEFLVGASEELAPQLSGMSTAQRKTSITLSVFDIPEIDGREICDVSDFLEAYNENKEATLDVIQDIADITLYSTDTCTETLDSAVLSGEEVETVENNSVPAKLINLDVTKYGFANASEFIESIKSSDDEVEKLKEILASCSEGGSAVIEINRTESKTISMGGHTVTIWLQAIEEAIPTETFTPVPEGLYVDLLIKVDSEYKYANLHEGERTELADGLVLEVVDIKEDHEGDKLCHYDNGTSACIYPASGVRAVGGECMSIHPNYKSLCRVEYLNGSVVLNIFTLSTCESLPEPSVEERWDSLNIKPRGCDSVVPECTPTGGLQMETEDPSSRYVNITVNYHCSADVEVINLTLVINTTCDLTKMADINWKHGELADLDSAVLAACIYNWEECLMNPVTLEVSGKTGNYYEVALCGFGPASRFLGADAKDLYDSTGLDSALGHKEFEQTITLYRSCKDSEHWVSHEIKKIGDDAPDSPAAELPAGRYACDASAASGYKGFHTVWKCESAPDGDENVEIATGVPLVKQVHRGTLVFDENGQGYVCEANTYKGEPLFLPDVLPPVIHNPESSYTLDHDAVNHVWIITFKYPEVEDVYDNPSAPTVGLSNVSVIKICTDPECSQSVCEWQYGRDASKTCEIRVDECDAGTKRYYIVAWDRAGNKNYTALNIRIQAVAGCAGCISNTDCVTGHCSRNGRCITAPQAVPKLLSLHVTPPVANITVGIEKRIVVTITNPNYFTDTVDITLSLAGCTRFTDVWFAGYRGTPYEKSMRVTLPPKKSVRVPVVIYSSVYDPAHPSCELHINATGFRLGKTKSAKVTLNFKEVVAEGAETQAPGIELVQLMAVMVMSTLILLLRKNA